MVVIRLSRAGAKKRTFYHICVSDRRKARDGSFIEKIGFYNPIAKDGEEKIRLDHERFEYWKSVGAIPSDTVNMLFERSKMSDEEIAELEQKKSEQKQKRKEKAILEKQKASTSFIQRYLQIGYNRAARMIEQMEKEEIVSEADRVGKRSVLKK